MRFINISKGFIAGLLSLFVILPIFGQNEYVNFARIDSSGFAYGIKREYAAGDTLEVHELHSRSITALERKDYKNALELARSSQDLSTNINYKSGVAESLLLIAQIYFHDGLDADEDARNNLYAQAQNKYLESLKLFERLDNNQKASDVCYEIGILYKEWGDFHDNAIKYLKYSLQLKDEFDVEGRASVLREISNSYSIQKKHTLAIEYYKELLDIYMQERDIRSELDTRREISDSYHKLNEYGEALEEELKILGLKKLLQDSLGIVNSYNNLGFIYKHLKKYKDALNYFDKSLVLTRKYNITGRPTLMEKTVLMNKGIIYQNLKDYKNSTKNFYDALSIWIAKGKPEEIATIYKKIGQNYMTTGDLESARNSFRQALSIANESNDDQSIASLNKELSEIYQQLGDDKSALQCYQLYVEANDRYLMEQSKRQELILQQQYQIELFETDKKLAIAEKVIKEIELENELEKKNNENALLRQERELLRKKEELQQVMLLNEQADKIKTRQELKIIEQQYEIEKKDKDNKLLQQRDSIRSLEVLRIALEEKQKEQDLALLTERTNNQQLVLEEKNARERFFIGIFAALALIVFLALRSYLIKKKANNILANQNKEIQNQRDQIEQSYYNLKQLSEIGKNITSNLSVERIIETVFQNVSQLMDATVFGVGLYNEDTDTLEFPGLKERGETIIMISYSINDTRQLASKCFLEKKAIFINDFQEDYHHYIKEIPPSLTGEHSASILYLPLIVKEKAIGVISVQSFEKYAYSEYHLNILRNLAVHTAIALENASNYSQIKDKTIKLENTLKDLKSAQSQLIQSEKMASLGQLTAGIAHEINNPINFVYAGIDGLNTSMNALLEILNKYEEIENYDEIEEVLGILKDINRLKQNVFFNETKASIHDLIGAIKDGAQRTAEIVEGLRNFSRINETELKKVNIHKGIESSLVLLKNKINNKKISIVKHFDHSIQEIYCYPGQLNQVYMNLLSNAIESIDGVGKITITSKISDEYISIGISDTGVGMSDELKEKIFDPFFTTKDLGKGTGLGLSISFGIIEKHKGKFEVESKINKGSTFTIYLPTNLDRVPSSDKMILSQINI